MHRFAKPVLSWAHGIVMGGGVGLMAGTSHRVATESSRFAMPEITIGLFPDVGASWLLPRLPGHAGRFLALTGAQLNAADAVFAGLADTVIRAEERERVFAALGDAPWTAQPAENHRVLSTLLRKYAAPPLPAGPLRIHLDAIRMACGGASLDDAVEAIVALPDTLRSEDPWIAKAVATLQAGSPATARLAWELQARGKLLSLADVFRMEYIVTLHCAAQGDLQEGVRALLIDKDHHPHWQHPSVKQATPAWADAYFVPPWKTGAHPLADLGG
jgi:enoyl-CoA hydratase/carnithine racemase